MTETSKGRDVADDETQDDPDRSRAIAEVDEELDDRAEGEGLAAEAGRGEEMGLAEG